MKKRNGFILWGVFFIAALIVFTYCLTEYRGDLVIAAGTGAVVLVAAYLFMDGIFNTYSAEKTEKNNLLADQNKMLLDGIDSRLAEVERLQKALFVTGKNTAKSFDDGFSAMETAQNSLAARLSEDLDKAARIIVRYGREDIKHLAQSNKKDASDTAAVFRDGMDDLMDQLQNTNRKSESRSGENRDVTVITECMNRNYDVIKIKLEGGFELVEASLSEIRDNLMNFQTNIMSRPPDANDPLTSSLSQSSDLPLMPEIKETEAFTMDEADAPEISHIESFDTEPVSVSTPKPTPVSTPKPAPVSAPKPVPVSTPKPTPKPKPAETRPSEIASDSNKPMSPDEIAAMFAAASAPSAAPAPKAEVNKAPPLEPAAKVPEAAAASEIAVELSEDPNKRMDPSEIAALFAAAQSGQKIPDVKKPESKPSAAQASGEPNKQMSPDEIAALIASMGQ